ncbi:hypothetical protein [Paracraurococcus ruber]|uniref:hypothetical protein n=1 Tax=Paracraurococcus ruber TaxID=77675 RepID=UPI0013050C60|nr:hypothetical protein [Paracraurococcus ruber]
MKVAVAAVAVLALGLAMMTVATPSLPPWVRWSLLLLSAVASTMATLRFKGLL